MPLISRNQNHFGKAAASYLNSGVITRLNWIRARLADGFINQQQNRLRDFQAVYNKELLL
jgi:hypothetical protein